MKNIHSEQEDPDVAPEYDFRQGTRGKYAQQYAAGSNIVQLAPDVAQVFPNADAVNEALRGLIEVARRATEQRAG
jgi:hypothetical protein